MESQQTSIEKLMSACSSYSANPHQPGGSFTIANLSVSPSNAVSVTVVPQKSNTVQIPKCTTNVPVQLTSVKSVKNQTDIPNSILQLQMFETQGQSDKSTETSSDARALASALQKIDQALSITAKARMQECVVSNTMQLSGGQVQLMAPQTSNPGSTQIKSSGGASITTPSPIIVKKNCGPGNLQFLHPVITKPPLPNKTIKCAPIAPKMAQSLVIKKQTKLAPNLLSKNVISLKNDYVKSFKSPSVSSATSENQSLLVPSGHTSAIQQKLLLQKLTNDKVMVPTSSGAPSSNKQHSFSFQISNGKLLNDVHNNVTVLSPLPPLQPLQPLGNNHVNSNKSQQKPDQHTSENVYAAPILGTTVEPISEKEYTISIPETDEMMADDDYAVSLTEVNDISKSFTIPLPDKGKSIICKNSQVFDGGNSFELDSSVSITSVPAILRRSNSDNEKKSLVVKRRTSLCNDTDKMETLKGKLFEEVSVIERVKSSEPTRIPSLYCDEELENELDAKLIPGKLPLASLEIMTKNNVTITPQNVIVNKDRRKCRMPSEVNAPKPSMQISQLSAQDRNYSKSFSKSVRDQNVERVLDDTPGLHWNNGKLELDGSNLQFEVNEFGIIELADGNSARTCKPAEQNGQKSSSLDDLLCCDECGCYGMPSEFVTPSFCSHSCKAKYEKYKKNKKDKVYERLKRIMKPRKILMKKSFKDDNPTFIPKEVISHDQNVRTLITYERVKPPNAVEEKPAKNSSPWICSKSGFSWMKYLEYCRATAAPEKFFKECSGKNCFKKGMKLEAIDPMHPSLFTVVTVANTQGHRLRLHFDGFDDNYDFWVNMDSTDIFPPGWCEKNKRTLRPPMGYDEQTFSWSSYLKTSKAIAATKNLFPHLSENNINTNGFRPGMKLEAEDRKNSLTCVATVVDVINNRILIHFDSWDDIYDYWVDPTSPYIHPVGWCDENGCSLTPPNFFTDPENFSWDDYLARTKTIPAPNRAFKPRPPHKFRSGMKIEAVDKRVPFLVRVATISDIRSHQLRISFDGWPDQLSYWVDDDSPDIHPVGWCLKTGHSLEPPLTSEDMETAGTCGTYGCRGLGNSSGAKQSVHWMPVDCPYNLQMLSPVQRDRLEGVRPPAQHSEPRPREPRKMPLLQKLSPKRKTEDEDIKPMLDEFNHDFKRKLDSPPVLRRKIENSVYEPGYLPNPNKIKPPFWGGDCLPLTEILDNENFRVDPRNWSVSDVLRFVEQVTKSDESLGMLSKHRIDGESFLMLAQDDLVNILKIKLGPAMKIYNSIIYLREKILS